MKYIMPSMTVFFEDPFWKRISAEFTWKRVYDRTHTLDLPYEQVDISPLPKYKHINDSLSDVGQQVALDIAKRGTPYVLWSGGIDSTAIVCSFLKVGINPYILYSKHSREDNPEFYADVISALDKYEFKEYSETLYCFGARDDIVLVTGDFGDFVLREMPGKGGVTYDVTKGIPDHRKEFYKPVLDACPVELITHRDQLWWLIIAMKWQTNAVRAHMLARHRIPNIAHFYEHELYQLWSYANRYVHGTIPKFQHKEVIYDYYKNSNVWEWTKKISYWVDQSVKRNHGGPLFGYIDENWKYGDENEEPNIL